MMMTRGQNNVAHTHKHAHTSTHAHAHTQATLQVRHASISDLGVGQRETGKACHGGKHGHTLVRNIEEVAQVERRQREGGDSAHNLIIDKPPVW